MGFKRTFEVLDIVVSDGVRLTVNFNAWTDILQEWAKLASGVGVSRHTSLNVSNARSKGNWTYLMTPIVRPWKLSLAARTIALPSGTPFFTYAHLRAN